jgi:hypothetical protein
MRIFIYKSIILIFLLYILFEFTIGLQLRRFDQKINEFLSKEKLYEFNVKLRKELKNLADKERIFTKEDAELLKIVLKKVKKELE